MIKWIHSSIPSNTLISSCTKRPIAGHKHWWELHDISSHHHASSMRGDLKCCEVLANVCTQQRESDIKKKSSYPSAIPWRASYCRSWPSHSWTLASAVSVCRWRRPGPLPLLGPSWHWPCPWGPRPYEIWHAPWPCSEWLLSTSGHWIAGNRER